MKQFTILVCFSYALLAAAAPQGYKYQQNQPNIQTANLRPQLPISTSGIYNLPQQQVNNVIEAPLPLPQPQPQQNVYQQQQQQQFAPSFQPQQQQQPQFVQNYQQSQFQQQPQQVQQTTYAQRPSIVTKDIYIHSAPDDTDDLSSSSPQLDNTPVRKNYRIVFIKAPTQNLKSTAAALKRAQASNEEKTVIYVLSKKPDINEIHQHLQLSQSEPKVHKPEVYFIKYKTTEEAQRAQQEIQAQYDALGGATHISDEGVAPVTSFSGGSLNLGNILPQHIQAQQQGSSQSIAHNAQSVGSFSQGIQQQNSFAPQIGGLQTSSLSSGSNYGVVVPSKRYVPAKTK